MAERIVKGSLRPFLRRTTYDYDPTRGYLVREEFEGASQALMLVYQRDCVRAGIACRLVFERDMATLELEDSTQQYTLDNWQILANEESRDGLSHPTVLSLATDEQIALIRGHLEANDSPDTAFADPDLAGLAGGPVQRFYALQQRGSENYRRSHYVIRHTTNAPNRWAVNVADVNVGMIYTPAQLFTEVQDPFLWIYPMPARLVFKLASIPAPTFQANYLWGWLKGAATETTAANNRIDIVTEYVLEQWSTDYYEPA